MEEKLSIIIPAYNEEEALKAFLPSVISFCNENNFRIIVVNDGSTDGMQQVLDTFTEEDCLTVIRHKVNKGYGGAIKSGIEAAQTPYVITIDADGQHYLEDVKKLYQEIVEKDADMIVGSRKGQKNGSAYRSFGKWVIRSIAKMLLSFNIYDINSGMKIYRAELAQKYIKVCPDSMAYSDVIALVFINQRHLVLETPISIKPRMAGKSTISTRTAVETIREILNIVVMFNPTRIFFPLAVIFVLAAIIWDIPIFLRGNGVSVGALLGAMTGIIFFFMGLIAEQLSIMRKEKIS